MAELAVIAAEGPYRSGETPDNVARAAQLLCSFAARTGLAHDGESAETMLVDLLADLMHLCQLHDGPQWPGTSTPDGYVICCVAFRAAS